MDLLHCSIDALNHLSSKSVVWNQNLSHLHFFIFHSSFDASLAGSTMKLLLCKNNL